MSLCLTCGTPIDIKVIVHKLIEMGIDPWSIFVNTKPCCKVCITTEFDETTFIRAQQKTFS
jgi:hypothetical protein